GPVSPRTSEAAAARRAPPAWRAASPFTSAARPSACTGPSAVPASPAAGGGAASVSPATRSSAPPPGTARGTVAGGGPSPPTRCRIRGCQPTPRDSAPHGEKAHDTAAAATRTTATAAHRRRASHRTGPVTARAAARPAPLHTLPIPAPTRRQAETPAGLASSFIGHPLFAAVLALRAPKTEHGPAKAIMPRNFRPIPARL